MFISRKSREDGPNRSDKKQIKKTKIEMEKEKQEKSDGKRKRKEGEDAGM